MDVDDDVWKKNIEERNQRILEGGGGSDFYVDEGLLGKVTSLFEIPRKEEIDVWIRPQR